MANTRPFRPGGFYIPALDGLRVVACLMVFAHHGLPNRLPIPTWIDGWWHALVDFGAYGVTIFFVLSSFLITRLLDLERQATGDINIREFYLRRILRIWPVFFVVICLGALIGPAVEGVPFKPEILFRFLTFNGNFAQASGAQTPYSVGILWSVCVEEQFYLIWPHIVKHCRGRVLHAVIALMILIGVFSRWVIAAHSGHWEQVWFNSLCQLDCFGWGAVLALLHASGRMRLPSSVGNALGIAALSAGLVIGKAFPLVNLRAASVPVVNAAAYGGIVFVGAAVTLAVAFTEGSILRLGPISRQGKYTYSLYCYHTLTLVLVRCAFEGHRVALTIVVWLCLSAGVTYLSWHYLEQPFLRLKRRFQTVASGAPDASIESPAAVSIRPMLSIAGNDKG
jgi:peptidoglycan/LPS O-acetylase OafA/YrhL